MTLSDPSWRVKTRPCPFYSQGRCLFSDSCNFLHSVTVKVPASLDAVLADSLEEKAETRHQHALPTVVVQSPRSIRSPRRSPRLSDILLALKDIIGEDEAGEEDDDMSDESDLPAPEEYRALIQGSASSFNSSEESWTLVNDDNLGDIETEEVIAVGDSTHSTNIDQSTVDCDVTVADSDDGIVNSDGIAVSSDAFIVETDEPTVDNDNTPVDSDDSTQRSNGSISTEIVHEEDSTVFVAEDEDHGDLNPGSFPESALLERARPSSLHALNLLSPVEISPVPLVSFVCDDPTYSAQREDSFDSGYADSWTSPYPHVLSPPRSPGLTSTFDLLSSPFGSPSVRVLSPRLSTFIARTPPPPFDITGCNSSTTTDGLRGPMASPTDSVSSNLDEDETVHVRSDSGLGQVADSTVAVDDISSSQEKSHSPSIEERFEDSMVPAVTGSLDTEPAPTYISERLAYLSQDDADDTITQRTIIASPPAVADVRPSDEPEPLSLPDPATASPIHQVSPHLDRPAEIDGIEKSQVVDLNKPGSDPPVAMLPFTSDADANDTVTSLFDRYSTVSSSGSNNAPNGVADMLSESRSPVASSSSTTPSGVAEILARSESPVASSSSSTPSNSARPQPVFVPPGRGRSGTITASPVASASPSGSRPESLRRNDSPAALSSKVQGKQPLRDVGADEKAIQDIGVSKRVPFGFRQSLSLGGKRISFAAHRMSRNLYHAPVRPRILTDSIRSSSSPTSPTGLPTPLDSPKSSSSGLRPLRLSTMLDHNVYISSSPSSSVSDSSHNHNAIGHTSQFSITSSSVLSGSSLSNNPLLSSARSSHIPQHVRNVFEHHHKAPSLITSDFTSDFASHSNITTARSDPLSHSHSWVSPSHRHSVISSEPISPSRVPSRMSEPAMGYEDDDENEDEDFDTADLYDHTIRRSIYSIPHTAPASRPSSITPSMYASVTPRPTLLFAIASDDVTQVEKVLESGEVGPNDLVGPQSALAFTLTNDQLLNKMGIVKKLLAYGADPAVLRDPELNPPHSSTGSDDGSRMAASTPPPATTPFGMDPATRYYVTRADASHTRQTSALIHRSFFRPLTRVRYELIGQDRALEQLFRVLNIRSQQLSVAPVVVLLCGPSGHGKSLLARKFGSLLDVPTHTVNMTTLQSTQDLWESYSMSPYEEPSDCTLAEFLKENEGKRCVVVLDEIEKTADEHTLWSLLMPWELGRCSVRAGSRHIDVRNVIWLGTSNIGHDLVFDYDATRKSPSEMMSRDQYVELMGLLRPRVSERLGASVLSRVTAVLPFVPFSLDEKMAIAAEALYSLAGDMVRTMSPATVESLVRGSLSGYVAAEGARSLYRAVSNHLVDTV